MHVRPTQIYDDTGDTDDAEERLNVTIFRELLKTKRLSVAGLARTSGVHKATIFRLLAGSGCTNRTAGRLASALGTTVDTLFPRPTV